MEVDGYGNYFFGDDANVLLSATTLPSVYYHLVLLATYYLLFTTDY